VLAENIKIDMSEFFSLVKAIRRARSILLIREGPTDVVLVHRRFKGKDEHYTDDAKLCWCRPLMIAQHDWRSSAEFAKEVLYPVIH
jgi:hypothetical protein